jgi:hypothetical protein
MNNRVLLIFAAIVVAICVGAIWFLQSEPKHAASATPVPATPAPAPVVAPPAYRTTEMRPVPLPLDPSTAKTTTPKVEPAKPPAPWEMKIDQILRADVDETATAQLLINILPTLPPEGQAEAAQHISNLLLDKDYARVAPIVKNPNMPEEVLDVFVTDLMNRDDAVKLPVLLDIAKIPNHPHREESLSDLQIFLDEDYGNDWAKWESAMKSYLAKQAAEEAADAANALPPAATPKK